MHKINELDSRNYLPLIELHGIKWNIFFEK